MDLVAFGLLRQRPGQVESTGSRHGRHSKRQASWNVVVVVATTGLNLNLNGGPF